MISLDKQRNSEGPRRPEIGNSRTLNTRAEGFRDVRRHPNRARILEAVEKEPGLTFRALGRRLDMAAGTLRHHITILEREDLVWHLKVSCAHHYFAGEAPAGVDLDSVVASCILDDLDRRILDIVPTANSQGAILDALESEVHRSTTQHRLTRLVRFGLLEACIWGRGIRYRRIDG